MCAILNIVFLVAAISMRRKIKELNLPQIEIVNFPEDVPDNWNVVDVISYVCEQRNNLKK